MIFEFLLNIEIEKLELDQAKYATFETMDSKPLDLFFFENIHSQKAFTPSAQSLIYKGSVKNDEESTNPNGKPSEWGNGVNVNTCNTTYDIVFVLSVQEATNTAFGFHERLTGRNLVCV